MISFYPHNYAEILAGATCCISFIKRRTSLNSYLLPILILTVVVEITAKFISTKPEKYLMYNLFVLIEVCFYFFVLLQQTQLKIARNIIKLTLIFSVLFGLVNLFFIQGAFSYNHYTRLVISVCITIACTLILFDLSALGRLFSQWVFWPVSIFVVCLMAFYAGNFFNYQFFSLLLAKRPESAEFLYKTINHSLNIVMYTGFSVAFIIEYYRSKMLFSEA